MQICSSPQGDSNLPRWSVLDLWLWTCWPCWRMDGWAEIMPCSLFKTLVFIVSSCFVICVSCSASWLSSIWQTVPHASDMSNFGILRIQAGAAQKTTCGSFTPTRMVASALIQANKHPDWLKVNVLIEIISVGAKLMFLCVFLYLLQIQNRHFIGKVRTFYGSEDILAGSHSFKGMFENLDLIYRLVRIGSELKSGYWLIHDIY